MRHEQRVECLYRWEVEILITTQDLYLHKVHITQRHQVLLFVAVFSDRVLCSLGWPPIHHVAKDSLRFLPASASQALGLLKCTTMLGYYIFFLCSVPPGTVELERTCKSYKLQFHYTQ